MEDLLHHRYRILKNIGKGGFSDVYLVYDTVLKREWALKCWKQEKSNHLCKSYQREVDVLSKLNHRGFPHIIDCFKEDMTLYVVMDYLSGGTLIQVMKQGKIDDPLCLRYLKELGELLSYLHNQKPYPILYIDLKPQNILFDEYGHLYLIDFGSCTFLDGNDVPTMATPRICTKGIT